MEFQLFRVQSKLIHVLENISNFLNVYLCQVEPFIPCVFTNLQPLHYQFQGGREGVLEKKVFLYKI